MSERKINLKEILETHSSIYDEFPMPYSGVIAAMKEACKQVLELAAENAQTTEIYFGIGHSIEIDKQSILDTINQIE